MVRYLPPGGPLRSPSRTRSTVKEGPAEVNIKVNLPIASHIMCSQFQPKLCSRSGISTNSLHFEVPSDSDMVLRPLQKLLSVCAFVQEGGNLNAYDPPKLYGRFPKRDIAGGQPGLGRDLSSSSGSGGSAGGNSTAKRDVLTSWVLGITSILKSLGDVSAKEDWRILATNHQHTTLAKSAEVAGNIWKQFNESADWTYPSTSTLVEQTLDVISAGGNLPAGKLTLPPFKRMQDFTPAYGKEVFILTDSVSLLGSKGKYKTVDTPYIHKQLWPHT